MEQSATLKPKQLSHCLYFAQILFYISSPCTALCYVCAELSHLYNQQQHLW